MKLIKKREGSDLHEAESLPLMPLAEAVMAVLKEDDDEIQAFSQVKESLDQVVRETSVTLTSIKEHPLLQSHSKLKQVVNLLVVYDVYSDIFGRVKSNPYKLHDKVTEVLIKSGLKKKVNSVGDTENYTASLLVYSKCLELFKKLKSALDVLQALDENKDIQGAENAIEEFSKIAAVYFKRPAYRKICLFDCCFSSAKVLGTFIEIKIELENIIKNNQNTEIFSHNFMVI